MTDATLAVLGGTPAFPDGLPFVRPPIPPLARVMERLAPSYDRGMLTNGPLVRELEAAAAERLGARHVVAVSACTSGLMLAVRALVPEGRVVLPSFTFSASAHAVAWNGLQPRFAECEPDTFQVDLADLETQLGGAGGLMVTHIFGAPCRPDDVERIAARAGIPVIFDAAHGLGSLHGERGLGGFGDAAVFSLSPTKPVVAGEGGLVATNRDDVAEFIRLGRDYGNPGDYDTRFVGLNARMSELHAAVALESLAELDEHLATRRMLADRYCQALATIAGIRVQRLERGDQSTWKDFTIAVDAATFGVSRDALVTALHAEGIDTRNYFDPPAHRQQAHAASVERPLPMTDRVASEVVSLPLYRSLAPADLDRVVSVIAAVAASASAVDAAVTV